MNDEHNCGYQRRHGESRSEVSFFQTKFLDGEAVGDFTHPEGTSVPENRRFADSEAALGPLRARM